MKNLLIWPMLDGGDFPDDSTPNLETVNHHPQSKGFEPLNLAARVIGTEPAPEEE